MKELMKKRKALTATGILVVVLVVVGVIFVSMQKKEPKTQQKAVEQNTTYQSLNESDKETASIYARLYEMSEEEVAQIYVTTKDWRKTAEELEKKFFTIDENVKYQMVKEGYSLEDIEEAERLSAQTGKKAIELIKAKGKIEDNREWSEVLKGQ